MTMFCKLNVIGITMLVLANQNLQIVESRTSSNEKLSKLEYTETFSTLFLNETAIQNLRFENFEYLPLGKVKTFRTMWSKRDENHTKTCKVNNRTSRIDKRSSETCTPCCETIWEAICPENVEYLGVNYNVVHPPSGFQIIIQGICGSDTRCTNGNCERDDSYHTYILVEDGSLDYEPPIRFVPIRYSRMCQCMNIGS